MTYSLGSRFKRAWNVFMNKDPTPPYVLSGMMSYSRPDRRQRPIGNDKTIVTAIMNRIALDVASVKMIHIRTDENGRYLDDVDSDLNYCLSTEANIDQTGRAFLHDIAFSMLEEGVVAVVPTDTSENLYAPDSPEAFRIYSMRVGKIVGWMADRVRVSLYNENTGRRQEITVPKRKCAIIENPFYTVMNSPSSTLQRLIRKMSIMDSIDEQAGAGKLDLIIQLPYLIRSETRRKQADERRKEIERQLAGSKYGIAYTDGTEHITQLNRPVENNLLKQIEYLTEHLYAQLGITTEIMNGSADEKMMLNYTNRVVEPILSAIADEFTRKFLTKTARTQGQTISFFQDPFKLVPVNNIAEIADKFTRNEIMTSNEIRQIVGMHPSDDPAADELRNKNLSQSKEVLKEKMASGQGDENIQNEEG